MLVDVAVIGEAGEVPETAKVVKPAENVKTAEIVTDLKKKKKYLQRRQLNQRIK